MLGSITTIIHKEVNNEEFIEMATVQEGNSIDILNDHVVDRNNYLYYRPVTRTNSRLGSESDRKQTTCRRFSTEGTKSLIG